MPWEAKGPLLHLKRDRFTSQAGTTTVRGIDRTYSYMFYVGIRPPDVVASYHRKQATGENSSRIPWPQMFVRCLCWH